jgi:hypothetical protein
MIQNLEQIEYRRDMLERGMKPEDANARRGRDN